MGCACGIAWRATAAASRAPDGSLCSAAEKKQNRDRYIFSKMNNEPFEETYHCLQQELAPADVDFRPVDAALDF